MEKMDEKELKWADVPEGWALCYLHECPMRERCLRWQAARLAPGDLTVGRCVMPQALKGERCVCFAPMEKVRAARGFQHIYDQVLKDDYTFLRKSMTEMLSGKRYYYEYMRGQRPLSPEKQAQIRRLFASRGYEHQVQFDDYDESFAFPWV